MAGRSQRSDSTPIRVLILGDEGVGKSTLIQTHVADQFPKERLETMQAISLPRSETLPREMEVHDTSSAELANDPDALRDQLRNTHVVLLLYAVDDSASFARLEMYWLPVLESVRVGPAKRHIPVLLIGAKADLSEDEGSKPRKDREKFLERTQPLLTRFHCLEMAMECSAKTMTKGVHSVFVYACRMVEYPVPPLYDVHERRVTPEFEKALRRIFRLCDEDRDNLLSEHEITQFQEKCFGVRLGKDEIQRLFQVLSAEARKGVTDRGITEFAFKKLLLMFITQSRPDSTWTVLRHFNYDQNLDLVIPGDVLDVNPQPGQLVELNATGISFLSALFEQFSVDGALPHAEVQHIFSIAPKATHPFGRTFPFNTHCSADGAVTLTGWMSTWRMLLALDMRGALENLYILGALEPTKLTQLSSKRSDELKGKCSRHTRRCFVIGASGSGKSALVSGCLRRAPPAEYTPTTDVQHSAVNIDDHCTFVFSEFPEAVGIERTKNARPDCDVICMCYSAESADSFEYVKRAMGVIPLNVPVSLIETHGDKIEGNEAAGRLASQAAEYCESLELPAPYRTQASVSVAECVKLPGLLKQLVLNPDLALPATPAVREQRDRAFRKKMFLGALVVVGLVAGCSGVWWWKRRK